MCRAWAIRGACVSIGYDVNTIVVAKVTYRVLTFSGHVVVYVGFPLEDYSSINEEDKSEKDGIYRELYSRYQLNCIRTELV